MIRYTLRFLLYIPTDIDYKEVECSTEPHLIVIIVILELPGKHLDQGHSHTVRYYGDDEGILDEVNPICEEVWNSELRGTVCVCVCVCVCMHACVCVCVCVCVPTLAPVVY